MSMATRETDVGEKLPTVTKSIDQPMIDGYGKLNGDNNLIHYDKEFARSCGFPDTIAHGLMTFGFISEVMTCFLGRGWVCAGVVSLTFIAPVHPGDTITAAGRVKERVPEGDALRLVAEVWCENQNGVRVLTGEASGLVD
jgi:3-hydroxybutyryl-CoA dehydratase